MFTQPWLARTQREHPKEPLRLRVIVESNNTADAEVRNDVPLCFVSRERRFTARGVRDLQLWTVPQDMIEVWPCTSPN
jgi:hypothetical protein